MCNEILVFSHYEAVEFAWAYPWAAISIAGHEDDLPELSADNRLDALQLVFADIESPVPGYVAFSTGHAHDILDFVTRLWDDIDTLLVHCYQGISRSAAVAAAISRLKFGDDGDFTQEPYQPNTLVYRTLIEVASGRGDYQGCG